MAYPLHGESGKWTSVTNATDLDNLLEVMVRTNQIVLNYSTAVQDTSGDGGTTTTRAMGLADWTVNFSGIYPKAAPRIGNSGLVTYGSGSTYRVSAWTMNFDFGEHEITAFDASPTIGRQYRPGIRPIVNGTYTAHASSAAALVLPSAASVAGVSSSAAATFKMMEDTTDPAYSGNIFVSQLGLTTGGRDLVQAQYSYEFDGTVTATSGTNYIVPYPNLTVAGGGSATGAVDMPDWGDGTTGPSTVAATFELDSSRTWACSGTGSWVYLRSLSINVTPGDLIRISGVLRGSGSLTPA